MIDNDSEEKDDAIKDDNEDYKKDNDLHNVDDAVTVDLD